MNSAREREGGFTLLEALASVAIMAAIMAALAAIAGQWLPNWRHGFTALQNADLVGLALDRIVEDVASAEYVRLEGDKGAPLFRGERDAVTFVRQASGPGAGPRLEVVRLQETQTQQGLELQRSRASFAPGKIGGFRDATTLLRPPFRVAFAYAGSDGQWRSHWSGGDKLPRAIRLSVEADGGAVVASMAFMLKVTAAPETAAKSQTPDAAAAQTGEKTQ
jgi:general secretion pathway protein J